ncbi:MAG: hypothetical protein ABI904_11170 [Chloroflexota bacterium]
MKIKLLISITFLIVVFGCTPGPKMPETPSNEVQPPTAVSTSIITTESPKTPVQPTKGANSLDNWEMAKSCVTMYSTHPNGYELTGTLALRSLSSTTLGLSLSLLDLKSDSSKEIDTANQSIDDADVSPSGQTLAYQWFNNTTSKWEIVLLNSAGEQQKIAWSSSEQDFGLYGLSNDHQVIIVKDGIYFIVNPYQGLQEKYDPLDFPDFDTSSIRNFFVSFDLTARRAIYKHFDIIILDLNTKTIIARIKDTYDRSPIFDWQPSNGLIALVGSNTSIARPLGSPIPDEIFIVEQNGQVRQLTHLYESFSQNLEINGLSWSPNGEQIAFWLNDGPSETLMVADALTGRVVNYCISSDLFLFPIGLPAPIWSPDGNKLLVENRYAPDKNNPAQNKSNLLIVDLQSKIAFPIAENQNPAGWMIKP